MYKDDRESSVSRQIEAYINQIFLYKGYGTKGAKKIQYVGTDDKVFDILTKPLSRMKFKYFHDKLGVVQKDFLCKKEK